MKGLNKVKFFLSFFLIEFLNNRLELFKVKSPVIYIFLLIIKVLFNSTLSHIKKSFGIAKIFLKKSLKLSLKQRF